IAHRAADKGWESLGAGDVTFGHHCGEITEWISEQDFSSFPGLIRRLFLMSCQDCRGVAAQKRIAESMSSGLAAVEQERRLRRRGDSAVQVKRVGPLILEREN